MGCSNSVRAKKIDVAPTPIKSTIQHEKREFKPDKALHAAVIIQNFYRRYKARLEIRRMCAWKIFQEIEYSAEQDQINLYNFFNEIVSNVDNSRSAHTFSELLAKPNANKLRKESSSFHAIQSSHVEDSYKGPHVHLPLTLLQVLNLLEFFKESKKSQLHSKYVQLILQEAAQKAKGLPNVVSVNLNISKQISIVGDLHGQLEDLLTIFHKNGIPSADNPYIFNGDFVDRGGNSLEIVVILCSFFILYPDAVFMNRGNHEDYIMNSRYGFSKELSTKYKLDVSSIREVCWTLFAWLPLATIIANKILVAHGGISDRTDLEKLQKVRRNQFISVLKPSHVSLEDENPPTIEVIREWEQILDLLWSDPQISPGKIFNKHRGGGCCFGPDISQQVLQKHGWDLLIRSHECKFEGYEYTHDKKVLTIFSASSYYAESSNLGAYLKLDISLTPRIVQFTVAKDRKPPSFNQSVGKNEESALAELREKIYTNKDELMKQFVLLDTNKNGKITVGEWAGVLEDVLQLKLPWTMLRSKLVQTDENGLVVYMTCVGGYKVDSLLPQMELLSETIYQNKKALETVFRIIDQDGSGLISSDEFEEACKVLNNHKKGLIPDTRIKELARTLDINKDGMIDFNEFLEAFRLVSSDIEKKEDTRITGD